MTDEREGMCDAYFWSSWTGQESGECPNEATHMESWFDEEGVEVWLCDEHGRYGERGDIPPDSKAG